MPYLVCSPCRLFKYWFLAVSKFLKDEGSECLDLVKVALTQVRQAAAYQAKEEHVGRQSMCIDLSCSILVLLLLFLLSAKLFFVAALYCRKTPQG